MLPNLPGWDSLSAVTRYHNWSELIGILFLALLVIAEIVTYQYGHRKDDLTEQQQNAANQRHENEMARLHLETAKIQERAASAELELAKIQVPRHLRPSAQFESVGKKYLSGIKFDLSANADIEPMMLAIEIRQALASIGMVEQLSKAANHWTPPNGGMPIGGIIRPGLAVRACTNAVANPHQPNPARILAALLADSGLGTKESPVFNEPWDPTDCSEPHVLHVEVGSKILKSWQPPAGATVVYPSFELQVPSDK